jgi:hypothetical protein
MPVPAPQPEPTPVAPANNPDGRVERVTRVDQGHARVTGWASDADAASAAMTVRALVEGTPAAETSAGITRPAVGPHGFDFVVPVDDFRRTICILAVNLGGGSDTLLKGCDAVPEVGDFNDDGFISCDELNQLKANYGKSGSGLTGDLNNDGTVNIFDLSLMLSHFRPPPGAPTTC